jgi:hypothetical protein
MPRVSWTNKLYLLYQVRGIPFRRHSASPGQAAEGELKRELSYLCPCGVGKMDRERQNLPRTKNYYVYRGEKFKFLQVGKTLVSPRQVQSGGEIIIAE